MVGSVLALPRTSADGLLLRVVQCCVRCSVSSALCPVLSSRCGTNTPDLFTILQKKRVRGAE